MSLATPVTEEVRPTKPAIRLEFLDGLRGLAAFYVLLFHAFCHTVSAFPMWARQIVQVAGDGKYAVGVFIVLSGYCLMLPIARSKDFSLKGGFFGYIGRRMRRILPPYYAALAIALVPVALSQLPKYLRGHADTIKYPVSFDNIIAHLLLLHNLNPAWVGTIDAPMWSISTEWEIYFLLPLIFLPVWKKAGNIALIVCGFAVGLLPYALPCAHMVSEAFLWFAGLFATGMAAAAFCFTPKYAEMFRKWGPYAGIASLGIYIVLVVAGMVFKPWGQFIQITVWLWPFHALAGFSAAALIIYSYHQIATGVKPSLLLRILESNFAVRIGAFSYSLYLTHEVFFDMCGWFTDRHHIAMRTVYLANWFIEAPAALAFAYLFHLLVERPFLTSREGPKPTPTPAASDRKEVIAVEAAAL